MDTYAEPIPEGYHTVTAYLVVEDVPRAIDFYQKAFGARETSRFEAPDGKIMHAEMEIGDSKLMLGTPCPDGSHVPPSQLGGTSVSLHLYVHDADAAYDRAILAGAKSEMEVEDTFWGDRMGQVSDPFGHRWSLATHTEDLTERQIRQRAETFFAAHAH